MKAPIAEILLAGPRGFCAGVERAIDIVEVALSVCPPPVYVRREIVHNRLVVETLRQKGAIFVDELDEVPDDATVIFSAHGISPAVREEARRRGLRVIDATCPLVTKVHLEAIRYAREGYSIVLIGHEDHDEVIGTLGEAPERIIVVDSVEEVERLRLPDPEKVAYLTQTTLSVDDTRDVIEALRRHFPKIVGPSRDDICYATQNRQTAVKRLVDDVDVLLVIGAANSSNAKRLVEVARTAGTSAYLINDVGDIRPEWLRERRAGRHHRRRLHAGDPGLAGGRDAPRRGRQGPRGPRGRRGRALRAAPGVDPDGQGAEPDAARADGHAAVHLGPFPRKRRRAVRRPAAAVSPQEDQCREPPESLAPWRPRLYHDPAAAGARDHPERSGRGEEAGRQRPGARHGVRVPAGIPRGRARSAGRRVRLRARGRVLGGHEGNGQAAWCGEGSSSGRRAERSTIR